MAMEAIKGAGMTYQGSVSSAESQPKTDSAVKAAETDAPEKGIVSENIKQAGEENVNTSQEQISGIQMRRSKKPWMK